MKKIYLNGLKRVLTPRELKNILGGSGGAKCSARRCTCGEGTWYGEKCGDEPTNVIYNTCGGNPWDCGNEWWDCPPAYWL